jgi:hypothetical protein
MAASRQELVGGGMGVMQKVKPPPAPTAKALAWNRSGD